MRRSYPFEDAEARARMRALTDYWRVRHRVESAWEGGRVRLRGRKLGVRYDATVTVGDGALVAEVEVGLLADRLGGPRYVERKLDEYLDPSRSLESLQARVPAC